MKEQFTVWRPNTASRTRMAQIDTVLEHYRGLGIKLTLRQLYYQLVSKAILDNNQKEYKRLGELLSKARLGGAVDWSVIEDRVRQPQASQEWDSISSIVDSAIASFRLPRWDNQENYVELWCEKDALASVIEPICSDLHVTLMVNRGYSSSSAMYAASKRFIQQENKPCTIIYLGDFDPSGEDMVRDIRDRMELFGVDVKVIKLALTPAQIKQYKLPHNPAKITDSRYDAFVGKHGEKSYEVDALDPLVLQKMIRRSIESRMDLKKYQRVISKEKTLTSELSELASNI